MLYGGEATGLVLAERVRLPFAILEPIIERMRFEQLVEVRGTTGTSAASYRYATTDLGRSRAVQYLEINQYIGPAPVPLASYVKQMRAPRRLARFHRSRASTRRVRASHRQRRHPRAARSGGQREQGHLSVRPPGNGKTVLAEGLGRTVGGDMHMPYAIDVEGHIVTMFDPISHEPLEDLEVNPSSIIAAEPRDRRWVRIRRPVVMVGGEPTIEMLDLTFNPLARFYEAPLQLKANGGIFLWMTSAASACVRRTC